MLQCLTLLLPAVVVHSFSIAPHVPRLASLHSLPRSRVTDPTGPTPEPPAKDLPTIDWEDVPNTEYDPDNHPIPHQPWRRGLTAGCEDPIDAPWRQEAEEIIEAAVDYTGGTLIDITWFLTSLVVTIDDDWEKVHTDLLDTDRPVIDVEQREPVLYHDPDDPNPQDIWIETEEDEVYQEEEPDEEEEHYGPLLPPEKVPRKVEFGEDAGMVVEPDGQMTREEHALGVALDMERAYHDDAKPAVEGALLVDQTALSTIAGSIMDGLEPVEERLQVLARHELVLSSPGPKGVLETQRQFDNNRGEDVLVQTQDPWESNRTIRGKLVDRNSMDVILNKNGRMVTIPLNFVRCVLLRTSLSDDDWEEDEDDEDWEAASQEDFEDDEDD